MEEDVGSSGVDAVLVKESEAWGRGRGCTETCEAILFDGLASTAFERSVGFYEVNRIICFRKVCDSWASVGVYPCPSSSR